MKKVKNVRISLFIILFFFLIFSPKTISATTIEDTTFPADVGKTYTWKLTDPPEAKGAKFSFKSESIEKGVHNSIDALIVYCTMRTYFPPGGWNTFLDNELYIAANNTQNYLVFENYMGGPVVIPTPINLTLVAEAFGSSKYASNYSLGDDKFILNYPGGISEEYTFNTKGFLTIVVSKEDEKILSKAVLDTGDGAAIPFGNFYLIFVVISVIAVAYIKKLKIK